MNVNNTAGANPYPCDDHDGKYEHCRHHGCGVAGKVRGQVVGSSDAKTYQGNVRVVHDSGGGDTRVDDDGGRVFPRTRSRSVDLTGLARYLVAVALKRRKPVDAQSAMQ